MTRLIDADALIQGAEKLLYKGNPVVAFMQKQVDKQPTVDAVPVVRCKDCKHFRTFHTASDGEEIRACVGKGIVDLNYDDFCSKGERKNNG